MYGQEQIPILCRSCGGPSTPLDALRLRCAYCGAEDQLPASEAERAMELRRRVAIAAAQVAQLGGMARALSAIYEDPKALLRVALPYGLLLLIAGSSAAFSALQSLLNSSPQYRVVGLITASQSLLPVLAIALGPVVALAIGRYRFRTRIRPLLRAKAPLSPGAPARCRACGGALPQEAGPYLTCRYCMTTSLVTEELSRDRERLLAEEASSYRDRSHRVGAQAVQIGADMNRLFMIFMVGGVGLTWILGFLVGALLEALLAP